MKRNLELHTFISGFFDASKVRLYVVTKQTHAVTRQRVNKTLPQRTRDRTFGPPELELPYTPTYLFFRISSA